jgi:cell division protease FtsH
MTLAELRANLSMYLAGRASEEIFFGRDKITTGAESDIAVATRLTRMAITVAGMSPKIGLVSVNQVMALNSRNALENASEKTAQIVDEEVKSWMDAAHADAARHLSRGRATVKKLAEELLKRETLTGDEIQEIVFGKKAKAGPKTSAKKTKKREQD